MHTKSAEMSSDKGPGWIPGPPLPPRRKDPTRATHGTKTRSILDQVPPPPSAFESSDGLDSIKFSNDDFNKASDSQAARSFLASNSGSSQRGDHNSLNGQSTISNNSSHTSPVHQLPVNNNNNNRLYPSLSSALSSNQYNSSQLNNLSPTTTPPAPGWHFPGSSPQGLNIEPILSPANNVVTNYLYTANCNESDYRNPLRLGGNPIMASSLNATPAGTPLSLMNASRNMIPQSFSSPTISSLQSFPSTSLPASVTTSPLNHQNYTSNPYATINPLTTTSAHRNLMNGPMAHNMTYSYSPAPIYGIGQRPSSLALSSVTYENQLQSPMAQQQHKMEMEVLNLIKSFGKKRDDNNLIDLGGGRPVSPVNGNGVDEVLTLFDPLLTKNELPFQTFDDDFASTNTKGNGKESRPPTSTSSSASASSGPAVEVRSPTELTRGSHDIDGASSQQRSSASSLKTSSSSRSRGSDDCEVVLRRSSPYSHRQRVKTASPYSFMSEATSSIASYCNYPDLERPVRVCPKKNGIWPELNRFALKLRALREEFRANDPATNMGLVISPILDSRIDASMSVKLVIETDFSSRPEMFTCDVNTSVEHIISHVICSQVDDATNISMDDYLLKVYGLNEYLSNESILANYSYVHQCLKFDRDVRLSLVNIRDVRRMFARTSKDDTDDIGSLTLSQLLPHGFLSNFESMSCESVGILLDTLHKEMTKMRQAARDHWSNLRKSIQGIYQTIKNICVIFSQCEPILLTEAVNNLQKLCSAFDDYKSELTNGDSSSSENGERKEVKRSELELKVAETLENALNKVQSSLSCLISVYSKSFPVEFELDTGDFDSMRSEEYSQVTVREKREVKELCSIGDTLQVYIGVICHLPNTWISSYTDFIVHCELWYGERRLWTECTGSAFVNTRDGFFLKIDFDHKINYNYQQMCVLPREARLKIILYASRLQAIDPAVAGSTNVATASSKSNHTHAHQSQQRSTVIGDQAEEERVILGVGVLYLFDDQQMLKQGSYLVGMWSNETIARYRLEHITSSCFNITECPIVEIGLPQFGNFDIVFPPVIWDDRTTVFQRSLLNPLDPASQQDLYCLLNHDPNYRWEEEEKAILWDKRSHLTETSGALPKVLQAAHGWDWARLPDIYATAKNWHMTDVDALQLLLPQFPDMEIRKMAVDKIKNILVDDLCDFLPQLVQALRFEAWLESSGLVWMLLERALTNVRVAHHLYWLLKQYVDDPLFSARCRIVLNALLKISGSAMRQAIDNQESLLVHLDRISARIKQEKESNRLIVLSRELEGVDGELLQTATCLPLSPSTLVCGLDVKSCSYFTSNTLPLKLVFKSTDFKPANAAIETIYKVGDDLRQDMLTIQLIRMMDKLWLKEGLDLKMVTFDCVATGEKKGMVEMVKNSETLRKIHTEHGLTGSFKDKPIAEWLQKHNTSELEYSQAVENFTCSCAGYAVATYILGVMDRHNDNIMLTTSGHLFHIDFGKFLGDAQMVGNIKRDRVPFVFTSDMAYVINGGDRPSKRFHSFIDLCGQAFNVVRRHSALFLGTLSVMSCASIPAVTSDSVEYMHRALLPRLSEGEAMAEFTRMIQESLKSKSTQLNFFIHNLAQLRFTGDHNDSTTLSFIPKTFTRDTDGKIIGLNVIDVIKKYEPEKQYFYVIEVCRENQMAPDIVLRTYREFCELHQKLCSNFLLYKFHPLPRPNGLIGRSNTREVAERRKIEIAHFLQKLLCLATEIAHSDLVYTFFHPILRDQDVGAEAQPGPSGYVPASPSAFPPTSPSASQSTSSVLKRRDSIYGFGKSEIKLSLSYKNMTLTIMVLHAKNLPSVRSSSPPDTYVKTYLLPDPHKKTKRKTRVVYKNSHPSFMEMIVYMMAPDELQTKLLNVSVWDHDQFHENVHLGSVSIDLKSMDIQGQEVVSWYPIDPPYRT